jgi:hypothetical protein
MTTTTTTTTTRIDDPAQWRAGDVLHVESEHGTLTSPLHSSHGNLPGLFDAAGCAARYLDGSLPLLYRRHTVTAYVTREVPALPTAPNTILLVVEMRDGTVWPLVVVDQIEAFVAYAGTGRRVGHIDPGDVVAWTPVVPGERVTR